MLDLGRLLFVIGSATDIIGALVLAQSFIVKRLPALTFEGTSGYGSPANVLYIAGAIAQKADAQVGFGVMALGFGLQSVDYLFVPPEGAPMFSWWVVLLIATVWALVLYRASVLFRRVRVASFGKEMLAHVVMRSRSPSAHLIRVAVGHLAPDAAQREGESESAFVERIERFAEQDYGVTRRS